MLSQRELSISVRWLALFVLAVVVSLSNAALPSLQADEPVNAQEEPAQPDDEKQQDEPAARKTPLARLVKVNSPVNDQVFRNVRNTALKLQDLATTEDRPAFLFL